MLRFCIRVSVRVGGRRKPGQVNPPRRTLAVVHLDKARAGMAREPGDQGAAAFGPLAEPTRDRPRVE